MVVHNFGFLFAYIFYSGLDREYWHADAVSENPFIANCDEAYGFIANIPCILKKKK